VFNFLSTDANSSLVSLFSNATNSNFREKRFAWLTSYVAAPESDGEYAEAFTPQLRLLLDEAVKASDLASSPHFTISQQQRTDINQFIASATEAFAVTGEGKQTAAEIISKYFTSPQLPNITARTYILAGLIRPTLSNAELDNLYAALNNPANATIIVDYSSGSADSSVFDRLYGSAVFGQPTFDQRQSIAMKSLSNFVSTDGTPRDDRRRMAILFTNHYNSPKATGLLARLKTIDIGYLQRYADAAASVESFLRRTNQPLTLSADPKPLLDQIAYESDRFRTIADWIQHHPGVDAAVVAVVAYVLLFFCRPLLFMRFDAHLTNVANGIDSPLIKSFFSAVAVLSTLKTGYLVQRAWVKVMLPSTRLDLRKQLAETQAYVPLSVEVVEHPTAEAIPIARVTGDALSTFVNRRATRLLLTGEGGIGKTTLAHHIARMAQDDNKSARLWNRLSVAVVIDSSFDGAAATTDQLLNVIVARLAKVAPEGTPITHGLVKAMLASKRLLLVIDGLSEMKSKGGDAVEQFLRDETVNAVVVTSRMETSLQDLAPVIVRPQRIETESLAEYIRRYSEQNGLQDLFTKDVIRIAAFHLGRLGDSLTPLLITLYTQVLQSMPPAARLQPDDAPNIPDLMLAYVESLNAKVHDSPINQAQLVAGSMNLATMCCIESGQYCSAGADVDKAAAVVPVEMAFFERLRLVAILERKTQFRFVYDPLCEYLAALSVIGNYQTTGLPPKLLAPKVDERGRLALRDFIAKIRDCVETSKRIVLTGDTKADLLLHLSKLEREVFGIAA
jgi:hypothetical protein